MAECIHCGYDLGATACGVCPECGGATDAATVDQRERAVGSFLGVAWLIAVLSPAIPVSAMFIFDSIGYPWISLRCWILGCGLLGTIGWLGRRLDCRPIPRRRFTRLIAGAFALLTALSIAIPTLLLGWIASSICC